MRLGSRPLGLVDHLPLGDKFFWCIHRLRSRSNDEVPCWLSGGGPSRWEDRWLPKAAER